MAKLKQRPDGYYCAWYKGKQFLGKTPDEAKAKRDTFRYEMEHGIEKQEPITVFDLCDQWLPVPSRQSTVHLCQTHGGRIYVIEPCTKAI